MAKIESYKDLIAYQKGYLLVLDIYRLTRKLPAEELYGLSSQMRRCAVSIPSNIAEGYMRGTKEYIHFLKIALGSTAELETQLSLCRDLCYIEEQDVNRLIGLSHEVMKLLKTYIHKIGSSQ